MEMPLVIRLEVENMKQTILTALSPLVVQESLQRAVDLAVANFDLNGAVQRATQNALEEMVQNALRTACNDIRWDAKTRELLRKKLLSAMLAEENER